MVWAAESRSVAFANRFLSIERAAGIAEDIRQLRALDWPADAIEGLLGGNLERLLAA